ncbi:MAG: hypothetical protein CAF42_002850 [Nitrospira sp. CG24B]|jgi:hypothetical protein|nr:hypothetical protein [Nitrospira sp.]THJ17333.1 MAG: hypothetical protein CAF42_002850 [Nitrospira sp. CG24B]TKB64428.1 MAG: hypothetical protein E8D48_01970 [Nitrospira sp.]TKB80414.1 MAG: hypothetical protein E8D42_03420 [Nitrospira sp.]
MNTSWGTKAPHRRKRAILRTKVRWEMLGLQDPTQSSLAPSIEDIRRQITSAASQGLSPDTLSRSREKEGRQKPGSKASAAPRKRGTTSQ